MSLELTPDASFREWAWIAEQNDPLVVPDAHERWPASAVAALERDGLLVAGPPATWIRCDCGGGANARIAWPEEDDRDQRPFACCEECGSYAVELAQLAQKRARWEAAATWLASQLGFVGEPEQLVSRRLWRLGTGMFGRRNAVVYLARRWREIPVDLPEARALASPAAVVLFVGAVPHAWSHVAHAPLSSVARWDGERFTCARRTLEDLLPPRVEAKDSRRHKGNMAAVIESLRREIVRHLKATVEHIRSEISAGRTATILPVPTLQDWAGRCGSSKTSVHRAIQKSTKLRRLLKMAGDVDELLGRLDGQKTSRRQRRGGKGVASRGRK